MRNHPDTAMAYDKFTPLPHVAELQRGGRPRPAVNRDAAVHDRGPRLNPFLVEMDEGLLIRRDVKSFGKDPVRRSGSELRFSLAHQFRPVQTQMSNQAVHHFWRWPGDFDAGVAGVGPLLANFDVQNLE